MLRGTVGKNGGNNSADVKIIQKMINKQDTLRAPLPELVEDGIYGASTQAAIDHIQTNNTISANGLIAPRSKTLLLLWPVAYKSPTGRTIRGTDGMGSGHFGASRAGGKRVHKGTDYTVTVGQKVKAPMSGYVKRIAKPYSSGTDYRLLSGVEIVGSNGYKCKLWYMTLEPNIVGSLVVAGQENVGIALTLQNRHGSSMTEHIHVEIKSYSGLQIDPTTLIK